MRPRASFITTSLYPFYSNLPVTPTPMRHSITTTLVSSLVFAATTGVAAPARWQPSFPVLSSHHDHAYPVVLRGEKAWKAPFWPFAQDSTTSENGLSSVADVLKAMAAESPQSPNPPLVAPQDVVVSPSATASGTPAQTPAPAPSSPSSTQSLPQVWTPRIPVNTSGAYPQSTAVSKQGETDNTHPTVKRVRVFGILAAIIGCIGGIALSVAICRMLVASGVCGWGGGRKYSKAARLTWQRFSLSPVFDLSRRSPYEKPTPDLEKVLDISPDQSPRELTVDTLPHLPSDASGHATPVLHSRNSIPPYNFTPLISPAEFFKQLDDEDRASTSTSSRGRTPSPSPSRLSRIRSSYASTISQHHRTKSAPGPDKHQSTKSAKSGKSMAESEWDIAHAYGAPRWDKAKSAGAMSIPSITLQEWDGEGRSSLVRPVQSETTMYGLLR
ncbi:hypothetical protein PLICRDRAFT_174904 [Plicaturopsis crispa FD-325 SS-3]|nr:hypothetical protein PLICRDRAFT_174904 [Plicaturopsis crispa FD-325 SS-3]